MNIGLACLVFLIVVSCGKKAIRKDADSEVERTEQIDLAEEGISLSDEDGITEASIEDPEMALPDNIQLYTYTGPFKNFQRVYMLNERASYTFYEKEDLSRVYHGDFKMTFTGDGSTRDRIIRGYITGRFKNGEYDGDWTFVYPICAIKKERGDRRDLDRINYTAKLTCSFANGKLNGPLKIVVTNFSNNIVGEAILNYKNGKREGDLNFYTNLDCEISLEKVKGQFKNDTRVGEWSYIYRGDKGVIKYDNSGWEISNNMIDHATGEKKYGQYVNMYDLDFYTVSVAELQNVIAEINPNGKIDPIWSD